MRYLVTGAQGFAGRFTCAEILRRHPAAIVYGTGRSAANDFAFTHAVSWRGQRLQAPLTADLRSRDLARYRYISCDLRDGETVEQLIAQTAPDVVVHLASALRDDAAEALITTNVGATAALLRALGKCVRKPLVILGSSGSVYGPPDTLPLLEGQRCAPHEPYAMSKFAAELVANVLAREVGIPLLVARIFNIVGPGQDERHVCGRFAAQVAAIVSGDARLTLEIGDLTPTRDFIDVRDVATALADLADSGAAGEIYNVADGIETAISEVLRFTLDAARLTGRLSFVERYARPADVPRAYADITKLRGCGFVPRYPIDRSIADLLSYYLTDVAAGAGRAATTSATS